MTKLVSVKNTNKGAEVTFTGDNGKEYSVIAHANTTVDGVKHVYPANGTHEEKVAYFQLVADQSYANTAKMIERQANLTDEERAAQREAGLKGAAISKAKFDAMSDEAKAEYSAKQREAGLHGAAVAKAKFESLSDEDKAKHIEKQREAGLKGARISAEKRANMSPEELQQEREEQSRRGKDFWNKLTPEQREEHRAKSIANNIQSALVVDDTFSL